MLERTTAYDEAIVADARRILLRAVVDISDPDKTFLPATASDEAPWSRKNQIYDRKFDAPPRYATLERNLWLLDGTFDIFPDDYAVPYPVGYASSDISGEDGTFETPQWIAENFSNMSILQAFSLFFSTDQNDGVPMDFTVEVFYNNTAYFTKTVTGNTETQLLFQNFTVYNPTSIKVTVTRWSIPGRRFRAVEIVPGIYEDWSGDMLEGLSVSLQGQFSCLTLPYGTADISMDNSSRRFEPRRKDSIFESIEERQGIELYIGVELGGGAEEYKMLGTFYQAGAGWKTSDNSLTMRWKLVDIIGLVCNRTFLPPDTLPTTLDGWIQAVVSQLGTAFVKRYHVDPNYASKSVTANSRDDVTDVKCGDIIRWACMAAGAWPRADQGTGKLTAEPLWNQGAKITLDNLESYPTMSANESLASLIFRLADGNDTEYVVSGNKTSSEKTVTVQNPFIHTTAQALEAARLILSQYGGNKLDITGRGDPASEIGDVDTVWLDESNATTARRMEQTLQIQDGVLQGCRSTLLQADGSYLWTEFAIIRTSGTWTAPAGVSQLRVVIGGGGQGGGHGEDGYVGGSGNIPGGGVSAGTGAQGVNGSGGKIWYDVININPEQEFEVIIGAGGAPGGAYGAPGALGENTTFGPYSSADGDLYPNGYTDIANGQSFARTGVASPVSGSSDGGQGGEGGEAGSGYWQQIFWPDGRPRGWDFKITKPPGPGKPGVAGASGFVMVTWEKPGA